LEAALNDVTFLCGPILVTTLSTVLYPAAGLTLAGSLVVIGMTAFIWQRRSEPPAHGRSDRRLIDRRLLTPAVAALFGVNMSMGFFFGAIPVTITAFAFAHHAPALAGPIAAVSSLTSLSAGLVYGARAHRLQPVTVMLVAHNRSARLHPGEHLDELGKRGRYRCCGPIGWTCHPDRRLAA
jgi:hypothetical protein